jgi:hypothetical protein
MGVNLSGSNLSGAKLLFANVNKDSCQADFYKEKRSDDKTELLEEDDINAELEVNPIAHSSCESGSYSWNAWQF